MDIKKLIPIINIIGVLVMVLWGTLGNDWEHSWIAVCVSGVITFIVHTVLKAREDKKE